jgi:hypothetical protein
MTTLNRQNLYTVQAQADLSAQSSRFKVITLNGTLLAAAGFATCAGILQSSCRSGEYATYCYDGITKSVAGAAVASVGWPAKPASGGFLVPVASGDTSCGRFLELANSGDFVQVFIDFTQLAAWNGGQA